MPAPSAGLLGSLAPNQPEQADPSFGWVPLVTFIAKGVSSGAKFIASPKGKSYLRKLGDTRAKAEVRYRGHKRKYEAATRSGAKKRWKRRMDRSKKILDNWVLKDELAKRGLVGKGPVLEYKRNALAAQWPGADDAQKAKIETEIAKMDKELVRLHEE